MLILQPWPPPNNPILSHHLRQSSTTNLPFTECTLQVDNQEVICDTSTGRQRPLCQLVFAGKCLMPSTHCIHATQHLLTTYYVWHRINSDARTWTRQCIQCQRNKTHRHTIAPLSTFATPNARFDHVHIDIVGPLPPSGGYPYLFTCIDRFTCWVKAFPISDIIAETVSQAFVSGWISRFGVPTTITTDRGRQFESSLFREIVNTLGSTRVRTTSNHTIANGMVERFHRQLIAALRSHPQPQHWIQALPIVLLGIRSSLKEDIGCTSAELVYGAPLRLPGGCFVNSDNSALPNESYIQQLKSTMNRLRAVPPRSSTQRITYVNPDLFYRPMFF